jgi:DNA mismatch repair protein MSH6
MDGGAIFTGTWGSPFEDAFSPVMSLQVLRHVVDTLDCRLLFATHYHALTTEFASHPSVGLRHMACALLDSDNNQGKSIGEQELLFLYKLKEGVCQQSYGLQVATLAGLPPSLVRSAEVASNSIKTKVSSAFDAALVKEGLPHLHMQWFSALTEAFSFDTDDMMETFICIW